MLLASQINRIANMLLAAWQAGQPIEPPSLTHRLGIEDGYAIAQAIYARRIAGGETALGRKIGFSNRQMLPRYGRSGALPGPLWAMMYDSTVRFAANNQYVFSLRGHLQPRVEPEIAFRLGKTPAAGCTVYELMDCIEWIAHAFEIVVSPYPRWDFDLVDAIAGFGLHGALIVGEPCTLSSTSKRNLGDVLHNASVSLSCIANGHAQVRGVGFGAFVMDSPVLALWDLHQKLQAQSGFPPLTEGELITTGSWTDAHPVQPGETWCSAFSGLSLNGLRVHFTI